jgi:hypothetical protein
MRKSIIALALCVASIAPAHAQTDAGDGTWWLLSTTGPGMVTEVRCLPIQRYFPNMSTPQQLFASMQEVRD